MIKRKMKKIKHGNITYLIMALFMIILLLLNIIDIYVIDIKNVHGNLTAMILSMIGFMTELICYFI